ncbi:hypothetical protein GY45DRAFT_1330414 [Cubamyces sp. BRFM 1775]|nr:hypothetical protein GY45DRAFT_1330414 [Cubamyces sp. BRFM 1775]
MDDFGDLFGPPPDGHFFSDPSPVSHDGALPRQIVIPPTRVVDSDPFDVVGSPYASPFAWDVQNFDNDVDIFLRGQGTINPALLEVPYNPLIPRHIPSAASSSVAQTESTWAYTDASSPPTSPEYSGKDVDDGSPSCPLTEGELLELAQLLSDDTLPDVDSGANRGGFSPSNEAHTLSASGGHEQALPQYSGAVIANAHGHDLGAQAMLQHVAIEAESANSHMDPMASSPLTHRKSFKVARPPRKQSTEKKYPCPIAGCNTSEHQMHLQHWKLDVCCAGMARPSNIKEHVAKVHNKERPFTCPLSGCRKANAGAGYCRKEDRDDHIRKKHPDHTMPPKQTRRKRLQVRTLIYVNLELRTSVPAERLALR